MTSSSRSARPAQAKAKPIVIQEDCTISPEKFTNEDLAFFQGWQPVTKVIGKDFEESARVGRLIGAIPKSCWRNALRVVQKLDEFADASYVEGIACLDGCPLIEHGWVCRSDGTVIDPTLPRRCGLYFPDLSSKEGRQSASFWEHHGVASAKTALSSTPSAGVAVTRRVSAEHGSRAGQS